MRWVLVDVGGKAHTGVARTTASQFKAQRGSEIEQRGCLPGTVKGEAQDGIVKARNAHAPPASLVPKCLVA